MPQSAWLLAAPDPRAAVQSVVAPSMKVTVPSPTPGSANTDVTVVLSVIIWPNALGLMSLLAAVGHWTLLASVAVKTAVVVCAATGTVFRVQAASLVVVPVPSAAEQIVVAPSVNATAPSAAPGSMPPATVVVTLALKVIDWP